MKGPQLSTPLPFFAVQQLPQTHIHALGKLPVCSFLLVVMFGNRLRRCWMLSQQRSRIFTAILTLQGGLIGRCVCIMNVLPFSCHLIIAEDDILLASRCITNRMYTIIILIDSLTSISQLSFSGLFQQSVFVGYMYNQDLAYRRTIETVQKICHRRHVIAPPLHVLQIQSVKVLLSNGEGNLTAEMILELELNIAAILKNPNMDQVTSPRITIERLRAFRFKHRAVAIVS